ncbi:MAG TPA: molybdate ABC transporter substrate-binding protein, partial [Thermoanaerobaculia bacterium]|nr:molybdate ABC transporter substrate-binding protein [Thermoanaerobaculia bacterium]
MPHTLAILVFAAASLTDALQEIGARYERETATRVVFSFAASSTLARQIESGAPADLFLSADEASMGRVRVETRADVLSNALVVVVPATSTLRDWTSARRIALAEPSSVPAGIYARTWLEQRGLWARLAPRVIPTENVRGALAAAASGNVDAAIVYRTDVSPRVRVVYEVPASETHIVYPFAVLANAPHKDEARRFFAYLRTPEAMGVFARHGFGGRANGNPSQTQDAKTPLLLTLRTATLSTVLLLAPGMALAWLLARRRWRGKSIVETLVALPLVMPPVATGLILLQFAPRSVVFTSRAVVLAMLVMSFPLFVRAARVAFEEVNPRFEQIARSLGATDTRVFFTITLPLAARGVVGGMLLAF